MRAFNYINLMAIVLVVITITSCRKELVFDPEDIESKLVVNSLFSTDSLWTAHISRSSSVLDTADYSSVDDATVKVYNAANSLVATLVHLGDGVYTDNTAFPTANEEYRIEVSAPAYPSVSALNSLPTTVPIISLDTLTTTDADGQAILQVDVTFDDPAGVANFYLVEMRVMGEYVDGKDTVSFNFRLEISSTDPYIETINQFNLGGFDNTYNYLLLSDTQFDGQNYSLRFSVINWESYKDIDLLGEIRLLNASEAFYNYRTSYERYENANGNPFAQPVQVYSNIENGIGIFAGGTLTTWSVDF